MAATSGSGRLRTRRRTAGSSNVGVLIAMGVALAGALAAIVYLALIRAPATLRQAPARAPEAADAPRKPAAPTASPNPGTGGRPKPAAPAVSLPKAEIVRRIDVLLAEYDAVLRDRSYGQGPGQKPLSERTARIDAIVREMAALGPDAVPVMAQKMREASTAAADVQVASIQSIFVRAIAQIPSDEALRVLGEALTGSDRWGLKGPDLYTLKMTIVNQVHDHAGATGLAMLAERAPSETDFRVRGRIVQALGKARSPETAALAERLAVSDPEPTVRVEAIHALGNLGDPAQAPVVERIARMPVQNEKDVWVKQHAVRVYAQVAKEASLGYLEEVLRSDPNSNVKSATITAVQSVGGDRAFALLERIANDPSQLEDIRHRARQAQEALARRAADPGGGQTPALEEIKLDRPIPLKPLGRPGDLRK